MSIVKALMYLLLGDLSEILWHFANVDLLAFLERQGLAVCELLISENMVSSISSNTFFH